MATGYILIAAILILGGVIATVGDRIGTRVGKARLSLFNLRPKKTAVIVTIFTGGLISASTLAILFAADGGLRKGVFELEDIQREKDKDIKKQKFNEIYNKIENENNWSQEKKDYYHNKMINGITDLQILTANCNGFTKQLSMVLPAEKKT